jgi:hypothetical protein
MKINNPLTNKLYERNDVRDDGYIFVRYLINRPLKKDGTFSLEWKNPKRKKYGKKELNPKTNKPFQRGDISSETGYIFFSYTVKSCDKNGNCYKNWLEPDVYKATLEKMNSKSKDQKEFNKKMYEAGIHKKRINKKTNQEFKEGDICDDGKIFFTYVGQEKTKDGYVGEYWGDKEQFLRRKISNTVSQIIRRSKNKKIKCDLDMEYMINIFPADYICPALGIKMFWGGNSMSSPSVDRILPDFGYVKGNVAWISGRANTKKLSRTPEVLRKMADWIEAEQRNKVY